MLDTGVAYAARIMPVRTLDIFGAGDAVTVSRGIRYSNAGAAVDVAAPGGGSDAALNDNEWDIAHCQPATEGASNYALAPWSD